MLANRYILLVLFSLFFGNLAYAYGTLSTEPTSTRPEMHMNSTSALLNPKSSAMPSGYSAHAVQRPTAGTQLMKFTPLHTTSSKKKTVSTAQFDVAYEGVQLPAAAISSRNMEDVINSSSAAYNPTIVTSPGPRKVGGGGGSLPPDPYMVPVGELPFVFFLLLAGVFCLRIYVTKQAKTEK